MSLIFCHGNHALDEDATITMSVPVGTTSTGYDVERVRDGARSPVWQVEPATNIIRVLFTFSSAVSVKAICLSGLNYSAWTDNADIIVQHTAAGYVTVVSQNVPTGQDYDTMIYTFDVASSATWRISITNNAANVQIGEIALFADYETISSGIGWPNATSRAHNVAMATSPGGQMWAQKYGDAQWIFPFNVNSLSDTDRTAMKSIFTTTDGPVGLVGYVDKDTTMPTMSSGIGYTGYLCRLPSSQESYSETFESIHAMPGLALREIG